MYIFSQGSFSQNSVSLAGYFGGSIGSALILGHFRISFGHFRDPGHLKGSFKQSKLKKCCDFMWNTGWNNSEGMLLNLGT
jgi:hypothetical protein